MKRPWLSSRRSFLQQSLAAGLGLPLLARSVRAAAPSDMIRHASFGAAGMAGADLGQLVAHPNVKLVCVAEVDTSRATKLKEQFPDLRVYQDWRQMLDKEHKNLDTVNVSTPDHMHAPMAMSSMQLGLNVYCQKPLTHNIAESRALTEYAREKKLVTQMGIQIHSSREYKTAIALIQQGAIGKVHTVHTWSSKKWGDPTDKPTQSDPVPATLDWDKWLGVCETRPFVGGGYYHPGNWRKRIDFGTGTFGDMGCHIFDPVFGALALTGPTTVRSEGAPPNDYNWATDAIVHFTFPKTPHTAEKGVDITWYDGDQRPPQDVVKAAVGDRALPDQGSLFLGEKGAMILPHIAMPILLPEKDFAGYDMPKIDGENHWHQFIDAVRGETKTSTTFDYAGPLTESVLLGCVATRFPKTTLEWDAPGLKFTNLPAADAFLKRPYRKGWEVPGLG